MMKRLKRIENWSTETESSLVAEETSYVESNVKIFVVSNPNLKSSTGVSYKDRNIKLESVKPVMIVQKKKKKKTPLSRRDYRVASGKCELFFCCEMRSKKKKEKYSLVIY